jgi:hypothetical protein
LVCTPFKKRRHWGSRKIFKKWPFWAGGAEEKNSISFAEVFLFPFKIDRFLTEKKCPQKYFMGFGIIFTPPPKASGEIFGHVFFSRFLAFFFKKNSNYF